MICLLSKIENVKIISQIVGKGKNCDKKGDRVYKYDKSCHICSMRLKRAFSEIWKYVKSVNRCFKSKFLTKLCNQNIFSEHNSRGYGYWLSTNPKIIQQNYEQSSGNLSRITLSLA